MPASRTLLERLNEPDEAVEARMIRELDRLLDQPQRLQVPPGTLLFSQDDPIGGIFVLLEGQVKLFQIIDDQEVVFHSQTAGRILGLLALTRLARAFFNCRTVTPVTYIRLDIEALDRALQESDALQVAFQTVLMRSMARRSTRLVELQTEVMALNTHLAREHEALAKTLRELQQAQSLLVESEKMATLGQMAAGVAHELNNPTAAIKRAADFLKEDLLALTRETRDGAVLGEMLQRALDQKPLPSKEQRARRRKLEAELGDEELASELVAMGIEYAADFERLAGTLAGSQSERASRLYRYYQIGSALRNIGGCAQRIGGLVKSLRSYSRKDQADTTAVDLHEGLEDTLRLFSHRLRKVTVERHYGTIPPVPGQAGELNQVWTNLIANALDAMHNQGVLMLTTTCDGDEVVVRIQDNGPGIPPEHLKRIFDVRFTTRKGRIEFGLGLGLSIARNIVSRHGGRIEVDSVPGRTVFSVCLPQAVQPSIHTEPRRSTPL